MKKSNCHTHTQFCDGKSTAEEMVLSAIEKGFYSLGFSGHSPMDYPSEWGMTEEKVALYIAEINRLKEKYKDKIEIVCGIELDADYTDVNLEDFDYAIGSVHQLKFGDKIYSLDNTAEESQSCIDNEFGGDSSLMAKAYFERLADFIVSEDVDVVGHFDLITKFNEMTQIFDENNEVYRKSAIEAVRKILNAKPVMLFEVNTGAMYRKGRTKPYPAEFILEEIKKMGGRVTVTSDAHCTEALDFAFEEVKRLCCEYGFDKFYNLKKGEFAAEC